MTDAYAPKPQELHTGKNFTADPRDVSRIHFVTRAVTVRCYLKNPGSNDPGFKVMIGSHVLEGKAPMYEASIEIPIEDESVQRGDNDSVVDAKILECRDRGYVCIDVS